MGHGFGERGLEAALAASRATGLWPDGSLRQRVNRKCVMNPSPTVAKIKYVGLDVHAEAIAIADSSGVVRPYGIVPVHTHSVDKRVKRLVEDRGAGRSSRMAGSRSLQISRSSEMGIHEVDPSGGGVIGDSWRSLVFNWGLVALVPPGLAAVPRHGTRESGGASEGPPWRRLGRRPCPRVRTD